VKRESELYSVAVDCAFNGGNGVHVILEGGCFRVCVAGMFMIGWDVEEEGNCRSPCNVVKTNVVPAITVIEPNLTVNFILVLSVRSPVLKSQRDRTSQIDYTRQTTGRWMMGGNRNFSTVRLEVYLLCSQI